MFSDPQLIQKLASNPKTSSLLADPSFMAKLQAIQNNPNNAQDLFSDPRMIQVLGVLMGVDMEMRDSMPEGQDTSMPDAPSSRKPEPKKAPEPEPEPEELDEEALEKKKAKAEADKEKALGTESYKKRDFDEAIAHYTKAWELFKDITYLNNLGAAHYEKGEYEKCVEACDKAIEEGREIYADFKVIAKSYARIGTAYEKLGDLEKAVVNYNKSLMEHRTPDVLTKLRAAEKNKTTAAQTAYLDPVKADEAREEGNRKFKETDFPGAVAAYSEMVKRAPNDPRGYSNRAAAFIKLFEFPSAVEDCNLATKKDPTFIRAFIRKAQAYFGMRKYSECVDACAAAQEVDMKHHKGVNAREIDQQEQKALAAMYSARDNETEEQTKDRLMKDPEVSWTSLTDQLFVCIDADSYLDHERDAGSGHAIYPPAGSVRSQSITGTYAEPKCAVKDSEVDGGWRYPSWSISQGVLVYRCTKYWSGSLGEESELIAEKLNVIQLGHPFARNNQSSPI